jgi:hypothetical protein
MSINTLTANVKSALASGEAYLKSIELIKRDLKGKDYPTARALILPIVAEKYSVPVVEGQRKAKGTMVLDKNAKQYETARDAISNILTDCEIYFESTSPRKSNRKEPVNPFARIVTKFKTKQQALKAFEAAWAAKTK